MPSLKSLFCLLRPVSLSAGDSLTSTAFDVPATIQAFLCLTDFYYTGIIDFTLCHAERNYVPFFQQSRKKFNKFIPHKNHLLYREVLTASGESPSLLKDIISYQRNIVNKKSKRRLSRCRFFHVVPVLIQTAGQGIYHHDSPPADDLKWNRLKTAGHI